MSAYSPAARQVTGTGNLQDCGCAAPETTVWPMDAWLPRAARMHQDRAALVTGGQQISYAELEQRALNAAGGLQERGVRRGDRVALALPPNRDFAVALHACLLLGAAAVPIDLPLTEAERAVRQAEASFVVDGSLTGAP